MIKKDQLKKEITRRLKPLQKKLPNNITVWITVQSSALTEEGIGTHFSIAGLASPIQPTRKYYEMMEKNCIKIHTQTGIKYYRDTAEKYRTSALQCEPIKTMKQRLLE